MHHFSTKTYETISLKPSHYELWRDIIPREAIQHEYLADGVLAVAAFHLATLEPSQSAEHIKTAVQYQDSGMHGFKEALPHISDDNVNAIFSFSIIILILNIVSTGICLDRSPTENLSSIFELLRGVQTVVKTSEHYLKTGLLRVLLRPAHGGTPFELDPVEEASRAEAMASLRERARAVSKYVGPQKYEIYSTGIDSLENLFEQVIGFPGRLGSIIAWPIVAPHQLISLLKQSDPMVLLIWIHYGVLALKMHEYWWGRNFGLLLIQDLSETLLNIDREWEPYMKWARSKVAEVKNQALSAADTTPSEA